MLKAIDIDIAIAYPHDMPRYARIHVTGGLFHVISRFHDRRYYLDIEDARATYLRLLGQASASYDARIMAYCLMSSHVHIPAAGQ